ncbi:TRAP transporter large permease subunit [Halalkalibacter alkaliphilus]|uniref:TRAP transporter large permease subunit n=1 Tax=Halalkalibacter alkaliphilus TaxID=2917993 RepID=A0A9X2I7S5_9BACI|nr:TRAP transporter large permease subunit [Halalkalibacter alkaliphilus]MCL7749617.1 TRAP transporter large permease subunit [Halalkalibacter alkaliphilus]
MSNEIAIILVLLLFVVLLALGTHIGTVLIATGIFGLFLLGGFDLLPGILKNDPFYKVASYTLTTIPLFILMSQFILRSNIIIILYDLVFRITKNSATMLGGFTLLLGGFLGSLSGSASAISAALAQVSLPELQKHGYNKYFAAATIAAAGSLSTIIPPSIILIVYGAATQTSIGQLFMAMAVPGAITVIVLFLSIFILYPWSKKRAMGNGDIETKAPEKIDISVSGYIVSLLAAVLIMGSVFGGIYLGVFTPTEAGAAGAVFSLIAAVCLRKVNFTFMRESLNSTIKITCMVLYIIIGASIFGRFVTLSLMPQKIIALIEPLMTYPILVILLLLGIYFILFMFIEGAAVIVMTASIAVPIAAQAGKTPLEFGILMTIICTAGLLTPPVGLSVFSVAGVSRLPSFQIFSYATIYAIIICVVIIPLLLLFPQLITWLPNNM